jgi:hypothetical protein
VLKRIAHRCGEMMPDVLGRLAQWVCIEMRIPGGGCRMSVA